MVAVIGELEAHRVAEPTPISTRRIDNRSVRMHIVHAEHAAATILLVNQNLRSINGDHVAKLVPFENLKAGL